MASLSDSKRRPSLLTRGIRLEFFTIGYNAIEGFVAIGAGYLAGSVALVGFGLDSLIEITAGAALLWRLKKEAQLGHAITDDDHSKIERRASYVVGLTFFALALYILIESGWKMLAGAEAQESTVGIVVATLSLAVMPVLAISKQRVATALDSRALASDAMETWVCTYLSLVLLIGLGLNAAFGWSWADPLAALAMLPLIIKEGWEALEDAREDE
ncbi:MAG: cation diffusion facilitator family transporter [Thermoleophilia bacterium]